MDWSERLVSTTRLAHASIGDESSALCVLVLEEYSESMTPLASSLGRWAKGFGHVQRSGVLTSA